MNITITGQVKTIGDLEKFDSGLQKKFLTIKTISEFPDVYDVDFLNDNIEKLKKFKSGDIVKVKARLSGREVQGKEDNTKVYRIMSLNGYAIENFG